jgi:hypothetical protein
MHTNFRRLCAVCVHGFRAASLREAPGMTTEVKDAKPD